MLPVRIEAEKRERDHPAISIRSWSIITSSESGFCTHKWCCSSKGSLQTVDKGGWSGNKRGLNKIGYETRDDPHQAHYQGLFPFTAYLGFETMWQPPLTASRERLQKKKPLHIQVAAQVQFVLLQTNLVCKMWICGHIKRVETMTTALVHRSHS